MIWLNETPPVHSPAVLDSDVVLLDGFDDAFVGVISGFVVKSGIAVYDYTMILEILMSRDGMDPEEALEWFSYNIAGAYYGPKTPLFLSGMTVETLQAHFEEVIGTPQVKNREQDDAD